MKIIFRLFFLVTLLKVALTCNGHFQRVGLADPNVLPHDHFHSNERQKAKLKLELESEKFKRYLPEEAEELIDEYEGKFNFYTDWTGCYEKGQSSRYRGKMFMSANANHCINWMNFVRHLNKYINNTRAILARSRWRIFTLEREEGDRQLDVNNEYVLLLANQTMQELDKHGIGNHNYCRDPDNIGKPWCFIEDDFTWEYCAVPECTPCWKMRQRAFSKKGTLLVFGKQHMWTPWCSGMTGEFNQTQCWDNHCWCSHKDGQMIPGTLRRAYSTEMNCTDISASS